MNVILLVIRSCDTIAQAIAEAVEKPQKAEDFKSITGKGAQAKVAGKNVKVVSPGYLRENDLFVDNNGIDALNAQGKTVVFIVIDQTPVGRWRWPISSWCGATYQGAQS